MHETKFSAWSTWQSRDNLVGLSLPGVYAFAYTSANFAGRPFSYCKDIVLFGMTATQNFGRRFTQFEMSIRGGKRHGPGMRMRTKFRDYGRLASRLYVAIAKLADGQREAETQCIGHYATLFGHLPEFNTKLWPKHLEEGGSRLPFRCVFDDQVAAEEFIERVSTVFDRSFQLVSLDNGKFKVVEGQGIRAPADDHGVKHAVDEYVGSRVSLTDKCGNTYDGVLRKAIMSVIIYQVEDGKAGSPLLQTRDIATMARIAND
jgi:hypothetical protein